MLDDSHAVRQRLRAYELGGAKVASAYDLRRYKDPWVGPATRLDRAAFRVRETLSGDCCYAFHCRAVGLVKLGRTSDIWRRWAKLETEGGRALQLAAVWQVANCRSFERALHRQFSADRRIGEWFNAEPVLSMLESVLRTAPGKVATNG